MGAGVRETAGTFGVSAPCVQRSLVREDQIVHLGQPRTQKEAVLTASSPTLNEVGDLDALCSCLEELRVRGAWLGVHSRYAIEFADSRFYTIEF